MYNSLYNFTLRVLTSFTLINFTLLLYSQEYISRVLVKWSLFIANNQTNCYLVFNDTRFTDSK